MDALSNLSEEIDDLLSELLAPAIVGNDWVGLTQYIFWMLVAIALLVVLVVLANKRIALVPKGHYINAFEWVIDYIRHNIILAILGPEGDRHAPFLLTIFCFVFINNVVGLIPGMKPGTGTIGVTAALGVCSFAYYVSVGVRRMGLWGYIKSFAPKGVVAPLGVFIAIIEVISNLLRIATLAIRLFCNMFAGHICLGALCIATSLCFSGVIDYGISAIGDAGWSLVWLLILIIIYCIEMMVAYIQAYVFTTLSAVYVALVEDEE